MVFLRELGGVGVGCMHVECVSMSHDLVIVQIDCQAAGGAQEADSPAEQPWFRSRRRPQQSLLLPRGRGRRQSGATSTRIRLSFFSFILLCIFFLSGIVLRVFGESLSSTSPCRWWWQEASLPAHRYTSRRVRVPQDVGLYSPVGASGISSVGWPSTSSAPPGGP